jgi:pyridoxal phosphate enzyme (YggS family)
MTSALALEVVERVDAARNRIVAAGGDLERVRIIAVTKGFGPEAVAAALAAGMHDLGENYAQELEQKAATARLASSDARWHFLGAVQRNKVARLAPFVACWQGVDRLEAGAEIASRAPGASVLVQVNLAGAPGRNGCGWADAPELVRGLGQLDLDVAGLMGVASQDPDGAEREFAQLASLREGLGLRELSIGMTDDLDAAVRAGSTMVRLGRALFGARPARQEMRR